jgi:hypothetical protein
MDEDDRLLTAVALPSGTSAKPYDAPPCYRRRSIPGVGPIVALVRR